MSIALTLLWAIPEYRIFLADALLNQPEICIWGMIGFWSVSIFCFIGLYTAHKGRLWILRMGTHSVALDVGVIRPALDLLFRQCFKGKLSVSDLEVQGRGSLAMELVFAPNVTLQEKERLLIFAEQHAERLLRDRFGYRQPFQVSLK
jgi:hypothetical protein